MNAAMREHRRPRLHSAAQVRTLDRDAIERLGVPGYTLMQRAAQATFDAMRQRWLEARRIVVLCGPGNNGGDGYVLARLAFADGFDVSLARTGDVPRSGDAVQAHADWVRAGGAVAEFDAAFVDSAFASADVFCDAVFGIGITREVQGAAAAAINAINARKPHQRAVALDLPSGLDADTGAVHGVAVQADLTVSFIGRKLGAYTGAAPDHCGERAFDALGLPQEFLDAAPGAVELLMESDVAAALRPRARSAHKGHHGHVLIVGGDRGMSGAVLLAARGALRSGAGLVSVATHPDHARWLVPAQAEAMVHAAESPADLDQLIARCSVIAIGPGLGRGEWGSALLQKVLDAGKPLVIDADALNLLAEQPRVLPVDCILTPHPSEAARLLKISTPQVQADRVGASQAIAQRYGATVVLKGAGTLVAGAELALCPYGNPGMGVGGTGDVLTGVIAALRAQGLAIEAAAQVGVLVHALAGDRAAQAGERGMLPSDLIDQLRAVVNP